MKLADNHNLLLGSENRPIEPNTLSIDKPTSKDIGQLKGALNVTQPFTHLIEHESSPTSQLIMINQDWQLMKNQPMYELFIGFAYGRMNLPNNFSILSPFEKKGSKGFIYNRDVLEFSSFVTLCNNWKGKARV